MRMMSKMCEAEDLIGSKGWKREVYSLTRNEEGYEMKTKCRSWMSRGEGGKGS